MRTLYKIWLPFLALGSTPSFAAETFTVPFTTPDGAVTSGKYDGKVLVTVSGGGQSNGSSFNDAFYENNPEPFHWPDYYQLTFGTQTLAPFNPSQDAVNFMPGGLPAYNSNNTYSFLLDTGTTTPSQLHFGVSDGSFVDNGGGYTITVASVSDILAGAIVPVADGPKMKATFQPKFDLTLDEVASMLGYTGFNWQQTVTQMDSPDKGGISETVPFLDPIEGGYPWQSNVHGYPFYYDENNTSEPGYNLQDAVNPEGTVLGFFDEPTNPCYGAITSLALACGGQQTNGYTYFTTDLVGVNADGTPGAKLFEFSWKSDFASVFKTGSKYWGTGGVVFSGSDFDGDIESSSGGAVLISQRLLIGGVPEPASWEMMLGGFGLLGASIRRDRKRAALA